MTQSLQSHHRIAARVNSGRFETFSAVCPNCDFFIIISSTAMIRLIHSLFLHSNAINRVTGRQSDERKAEKLHHDRKNHHYRK
jgi:hypothetical protein